MPDVEKKTKGPRDFTEEEKAFILKRKIERERLMKTDPKFKEEQEMKKKSLFVIEHLDYIHKAQKIKRGFWILNNMSYIKGEQKRCKRD